MATYQFKIELLPKIWAQNNNYDAKLLYDFEQYDVSIAWKKYIFSVDLNNMISNILPKGESWDSNLLTWGDDEHTDIKAWVQNQEQLESIAIRLDLRENIEKLANDIVALAQEIDCVLFLPETKQIINPNPLLLYEAIRNSSATKFVKEPYEYLKSKTPPQTDEDS